MKPIAVVILNWNGVELLRSYLPSVVAHSQNEWAEVVVVDNGSTDASVAWVRATYPDVRLIEFDRNWGFAEGYNRAIEQIANTYTVLLNSDVSTTSGWLDPIFRALESDASIGAVQPKIRSLRNPEYFEYAGASGGFIDRLGYPFCRGRLFATIEKDNGQYDSCAEIFWATGAALAIRTDLYRSVGGLDGSFFAHMEEIDLCWRLQVRGHHIRCITSSTVYHLGAATLTKENPRKTYLNFRNNLLMLYKNLPQAGFRSTLLLRLILDLVAAFRYLLGGEVANCGSVLRAIGDFLNIRHDYRAARRNNLREALVPIPKSLRRFSVLWHYYVLNHKTYNQLPL